MKRALVLLFAAAAARGDVEPPPPVAQVGVDEQLGRRIPLDLSLTDASNRPVRLGDLFGDGKPVLMVLAYYRCPMLCDLVLRGVAESMRALDWRAGTQYRAVTVSIDPRDSWVEAGRKQATAQAAAASGGDGWRFLVGSAGETARLADALGFRYVWDARDEQFAHPAVAFVLSPDGTISRYLYGLAQSPRQLKLALLEASQGKTGSFYDRVLLACYHYDPATRRYGVFVAGFLRAGAAVVLVLLAGMLLFLWRMERSRHG